MLIKQDINQPDWTTVDFTAPFKGVRFVEVKNVDRNNIKNIVDHELDTIEKLTEDEDYSDLILDCTEIIRNYIHSDDDKEN